jgi:methionyl-tRNA formyltransferase
MNISKTIVFFGTDSFSVSALQHLIDAGYPIAAVVTKPDSKSGRGQKLVAPAVKQLAEQHNIPVWQPAKAKDITDDLVHLGSDLIGVLSSFGRIIPQSIIDLFTPGILNVHPSLLPLYRGPSPIETALINGDTQTGASLMLLTAEMDAGPVYDQTYYPLDGTETQSQLYTRLADLGSQLLLTHLPAIIKGTMQPTEQKGEPTYSHLLQKSDAIIDPKNDTAAFIERHVRAYEQFPKTKAEVLGHTITITSAHTGETKTGELSLTCSDKDLIIDTLIAPNGRRMTGSDFLRGYAR